MKDFTREYFKMNEEDVIDYSKTRLNFFKEDADLVCKEIGDGNLNYVYRVVDNKNGNSVIIKQAGPVARISDEVKVSPDRNRIESNALKIQGELAHGLVPEMYGYDPIMNCFAMEDLSDHRIMRASLMEYNTYPNFADEISSFMANTLLHTSDVLMDHQKKKENVKSFINPELCEITEEWVYTRPFYNFENNNIFPKTRDFIEKEIWNDKDLLLETAKLKFDFMNNAQSLVHGDLHTGSIFIKEDSTKIIDPEFAFYGPSGYDVGQIIANLVFSYARAKFSKDLKVQENNFLTYIEKTIKDIIDLFVKKSKKLMEENDLDHSAKYDGFSDYYLNSILSDTAGIAGLEIARRIIGEAKVADITTIEDPEERYQAEILCLTIAKKIIKNRDDIKSGKDFVEVIKEN